MKGSSIKRKSLVCIAVLVLSVSCAWAQTGTSGISGTVIDPQGRAVPGAKVTITNNATNVTRTMKTSHMGGVCL